MSNEFGRLTGDPATDKAEIARVRQQAESETVVATVRCKFYCNAVIKRIGYVDGKNVPVYSAEFSAVADGSEENKKFFAATPFGQLTVGTLREDHFEVGKFYYIDITKAE